MSALQRFRPEDQDLLVGIFYRVGYWMSHIDDTDLDDKSEHIEHEQMIKILTKIAHSKGAGALVNEIAGEALRQKQSCDRWMKMNDTVLDDVTKAAKIINAQSNADETRAFGKAIMMIATAVAKAFQEVPDNVPEQESYFGWLADTATNLIRSFAHPELHQEMNISPAEDDALHELAEALTRS